MSLFAQLVNVDTTGELVVLSQGGRTTTPNEITLIADAAIVVGGSQDNATYPIAADAHFPMNVVGDVAYWIKAVTGTANVHVLNSLGLDPADASDDS